MNGGRQAFTLMALTACCVPLACSRRPPAEEIPPAPITLPATAPPVVRDVPPPGPGEVSGVVKRVFGDTVAGDSNGEPRYLLGDFNGDLSQDMAVVVQPVPDKLQTFNDEPRWMMKDPLAPIGTDTGPLRAAAGEPLLAIIHGNGPDGWRDKEATQAFVLKHVVGTEMKVQPGKEFTSAHQGRNLPRIHGDVIAEVLRGAQGYVYYTGPTYGWYDPKTFMGEPRSQLVHGRSPGGSN